MFYSVAVALVNRSERNTVYLASVIVEAENPRQAEQLAETSVRKENYLRDDWEALTSTVQVSINCVVDVTGKATIWDSEPETANGVYYMAGVGGLKV